MGAIHMKVQRLFLLLPLLVAGPAARADLVEPDHVVYGSLTVEGAPVVDGTVISLRLAASGTLLTSYTLGDDPNLGGLYALRVPMQSGEPRLEDRGMPGEAAIIFVNDEQVAQVVLGGYGETQRIDVDPGSIVGFAQLSGTDTVVPEGDEGVSLVSIPLTLSRASEAQVSVDWATGGGSAVGGECPGADYGQAAGTVTIPVGEESGVIDLEICGDTVFEPDEIFFLELDSALGAQLITPTITVTIDNDDFGDSLTVTVSEPFVLEPAVTPTLAIFNLQLSAPAPAPLSLDWATADGSALAGSDYAGATGLVEIPEGEETGSIAVSVLPDGGIEPPETFLLTLGAPEGVALVQDAAVATIVDPAFDENRAPTQDLVDGQDGVEGLGGASALALSVDDRALFVAGTADGAVAQFGRDPATGLLTFTDSAALDDLGVDLSGVSDVSVGSDARFVYAAARTEGRAHVLRVDTAGAVSIAMAPGGGAAPEEMAGAIAGTVSPDGRHLYVAAEQANAVNVYAIDAVSGALTWMEAQVHGAGGDPGDPTSAVTGLLGPRALVVSPDGRHLFVASRMSNAVAVFERTGDPASSAFGRLSFAGTFTSGPGDEVALAGPRALALSRNGRILYVVGETSRTLVGLNVAGGALSFREGFDGFELPSAVAVSPEGLQVAVTDFGGDAVHVYNVERGDRLRAGDVRRNGQPGISQLDGPADIAYSRDGRSVYVVSTNSAAVTVFDRFASEIIFRDGFD